MKTIDFLDEAKKKLGIRTDTELSEILGTSRARIGHYRTGIRKPDEYTCFQIAEILNLEPSAVISAVRAEGEADPERKRFWAQYAKRYGVVVSVPFVVAGTITLTSLALPAPANAYESTFYGVDKYVLYEIEDRERRGRESTPLT